MGEASAAGAEAVGSRGWRALAASSLLGFVGWKGLARADLRITEIQRMM